MVSLSRTSELFRHPFTRESHAPTLREHRAGSVIGIFVVGLALIVVMSLLPDIKRYMRMKTM